MPGNNLPYVTVGRKASVLPMLEVPELISNGGKITAVTGIDDGLDLGTIYSSATRGTGSLTVATAGAAGDTSKITIGGFSATFVSPGGTTTAIATALAAFINKNFPHVNATSAAAVVTMDSKYPGILGNFTVASVETGTIDLTPVDITGGTGEIVTPLEPITVQVGRNTISFAPFKTVRTHKLVRDAIAASGRYFS